MSELSPPILERRTRTVVLAAAAAAFSLGVAATALGGPWDAVLFVIGMFGFMGATGWCVIQWLRSRAFVRAHDDLVCRRCGYPLDALDGTRRDRDGRAVCPECGTPYDRDALRRHWRRRMHPEMHPDDASLADESAASSPVDEGGAP